LSAYNIPGIYLLINGKTHMYIDEIDPGYQGEQDTGIEKAIADYPAVKTDAHYGKQAK
jgi:hypothetical protein